MNFCQKGVNLMGTNDELMSVNTDEGYNGVCMEIAGIESCGLGYSAPEIPDGTMEISNE